MNARQCVDAQRTLPFGSPGEVRARIEAFVSDGGFVFNPVHSVQPQKPVENLLAMIEEL